MASKTCINAVVEKATENILSTVFYDEVLMCQFKSG